LEYGGGVPFAMDKHRNEHPKPLAADAIGRLPQHRQRLMDLRWLIQNAQKRVYDDGYTCELGQDLPSLPTIGGRLIPFSNRVLQLSACCHTQLLGHLHYPAAMLPGSSVREANGTDPVTKIVTQCAGKFNCR
jgi:hypothetical protein